MVVAAASITTQYTVRLHIVGLSAGINPTKIRQFVPHGAAWRRSVAGHRLVCCERGNGVVRRYDAVKRRLFYVGMNELNATPAPTDVAILPAV